MEGILKRRYPNSLPALILAASAAGDTVDRNTVDFMEKRIKKLEADLEGRDEEAKKSLRTMEQQFQKMKVRARPSRSQYHGGWALLRSHFYKLLNILPCKTFTMSVSRCKRNLDPSYLFYSPSATFLFVSSMENQAQGPLLVILELVEIKSWKGRVKHLWCIFNKKLFFNYRGWKYYFEISLDKGEGGKTKEYFLRVEQGTRQCLFKMSYFLSFLILHEEWIRKYKC